MPHTPSNDPAGDGIPAPVAKENREDVSESPFAPRAADADAIVEPEPAAVSIYPTEADSELGYLPPAKDHERLRLAAADMVEFGISLEQAAEHHGVDPDTLHVWHRTYVNFVGKENLPEVPDDGALPPERGHDDFNRMSHRQFDRNWAEMVFEAEKNRAPVSAMRRRLMEFPLTGWMFNGDTVDKIAVLGAVCVVVFCGLVLKLANADREVVNEPIAEDAKPASIDGIGNDLSDLDLEQQQLLLEPFVEMLGEYFSKTKWEERVPYVRNPEIVGPLMEEYYTKHPEKVLSGLVVDSEVTFLQRDDGLFLLAAGSAVETERPLSVFVELLGITDEKPDFRIDWETLVDYQPVPWAEFMAGRSGKASPFRVRLREGEYYNQPFMDDGKYLSFKLLLYSRPDQDLFGFVERESDLAVQLKESLNGELEGRRAMILNLRYPEGSKYDNVVEIESVVSESW